MDITQWTTNQAILYSAIIVVWSIAALILKGVAMLRAARKKSMGWFWCLLIFSIGGILPLLYLIFSKKAK